MRRFNILNIILGTLVALLGANSYSVWSKPYVRSTQNKSSLLRDINTGHGYMSALTNTDEIFPAYYDAVTQKNLFRPQRTEYIPPPPPPPAPKAPPAPPVKPKTDYTVPDITLRGVILLDDGRRVAIIEGSYKKFKMVEIVKQQISGAPTKKVKKVEEIKKIKDKRVYVGDIIGSFILTDIKEDRIILKDNYNNKLVFILGKKDAEGGQEKRRRLKGDNLFIKAGKNNNEPKDSKISQKKDTLIVDIISYDDDVSDSESGDTANTQSTSSGEPKIISAKDLKKMGSNQAVDATGIPTGKHISGAKSNGSAHISGK